jgi:hypothetical protein
VTDAIDWAIEAAANVANEKAGPYKVVLIGQDGSVMGRTVIAHGAPALEFRILRTGQTKQMEWDGKVRAVQPQHAARCETLTYQIIQWP